MTLVTETETLPVLSGLTDEQRAALADLPRSQRGEYLAGVLDQPFEEVTARLAGESGLPVADQAEFDLERLGGLPIRLINEYHCVPVRFDSEDADPAAQPLRLATSWPPDPIMSEWVFVACGREPEWMLAPADRIGKFITTNLGVGAESLEESLDEAEDDFDVAGGLGVVFDTVRDGNRLLDSGGEAGPLVAAYDEMVGVLGLLEPTVELGDLADRIATLATRYDLAFDSAPGDVIADLLAARQQARADRDWATADAIRDDLDELGIVIEDTADGARWHRR